MVVTWRPPAPLPLNAVAPFIRSSPRRTRCRWPNSTHNVPTATQRRCRCGRRIRPTTHPCAVRSLFRSALGRQFLKPTVRYSPVSQSAPGKRFEQIRPTSRKVQPQPEKIRLRIDLTKKNRSAPAPSAGLVRFDVQMDTVPSSFRTVHSSIQFNSIGSVHSSTRTKMETARGSDKNGAEKFQDFNSSQPSKGRK